MSWLYRDIYKKVQADKDIKVNAYLRSLKEKNAIGARLMRDMQLCYIKYLQHNLSPLTDKFGVPSTMYDTPSWRKDVDLWERCWKKQVRKLKSGSTWLMVPRRGPMGIDVHNDYKNIAVAFSKRNGLGIEDVSFNFDEVGYFINTQQPTFSRTYISYDELSIHSFIMFYTAVKRDYIWEKYCTPTYRIRYGIMKIKKRLRRCVQKIIK